MNPTNIREASFDQFNRDREALAQQFLELVEIVGNNVFNGNLKVKGKPVVEEINQQPNLLEAEKVLLRNLYYYSQNLLESRFLLGVLGRFKAGKSTLLNSLAGEYISPSDTRISTGVLNFTYKSDEEECLVVFDSGEEKQINPSQKTEYVSFRKNPDNEKGVHSVRHGSPTLDLQKEIIFVDTPGLEAVNNIHEKITLDFVTQCHAAVVVSTYPPFGSSELRFYEQIKDSIQDIFLVQNLPKDKFQDWVALEAQTLESLHKLGFFELDSKYSNQDIGQTLREIGDRRDQNGLNKFKEIHSIHLFSIDALSAYNVISKDSAEKISAEEEKQLQESGFLTFKERLYSFLSEHKGRKLLGSYLSKGRLILGELISMVEEREDILKKSLEEIDAQIGKMEEKHQENESIIGMITDRTSLKMMESHKKLKSTLLTEDFDFVMQELENSYGDYNVYRLRKEQLKKIKSQLADFNRLFSQRHKEFVRSCQDIIEISQEEISKKLPHQALFSAITINNSSIAIGMEEISGAGYIDYGFAIVIRGGMAYFVGSFAVAAIGSGTAVIPAAIALVGGAIGFGLSFPVEKRFAPFFDKCKELVGKVAHKPTKGIFEDFRNNIRKKLEEIEQEIVDHLIKNFKEQVSKNAQDALAVFEKNLKELREKKEHGSEKTEATKLEEIRQQLSLIDEHFSNLEGKNLENSDEKMDGMLKGLKGFIKKFGKNE